MCLKFWSQIFQDIGSVVHFSIMIIAIFLRSCLDLVDFPFSYTDLTICTGYPRTKMFVGKTTFSLERPVPMNIKCITNLHRFLNDQRAKENVTTFNRRINLNVTNRILSWKYSMKNADRLYSIFCNSINDQQRDQFHIKKARNHLL